MGPGVWTQFFQFERIRMVKVILGDCQALYRAGMARVLGIEDEFRIVAQCPDWPRLRTSVIAFHGALVIVASGIKPNLEELITLAKAAHSRVIMIADDSEPFLPYSSAGVSGVVYRSTTSAAFLECVRKVNRGDKFVPPGLATPEDDPVGARAHAQLTVKEIKIVALVAEGMKNKKIAACLNTTEQVVKNQLRSVYDKTGVSDRLELALFTLHHRVLATAAAAASAELQIEIA
jgi:DNA-binding NarL/FixJ family response regulator